MGAGGLAQRMGDAARNAGVHFTTGDTKVVDRGHGDSMFINTSGIIHVLRDPARGGIASLLNEIARASGVGIAIDERGLPINPAGQSACEILGMDPIYLPIGTQACW